MAVEFTKTETLTEIWVECDCCRLRMFAGFQPMAKAEALSSFEREGWKFGADGKVTCDYCAAQSKPVLRVV